MRSREQTEDIHGFIPLRASDLEDRVQKLGRGLGDLSPPDDGDGMLTIEPVQLVEALRPWILEN